MSEIPLSTPEFISRGGPVRRRTSPIRKRPPPQDPLSKDDLTLLCGLVGGARTMHCRARTGDEMGTHCKVQTGYEMGAHTMRGGGRAFQARCSAAAIARTWHIYDSQGQILALASCRSPDNVQSCSLLARQRNAGGRSPLEEEGE